MKNVLSIASGVALGATVGIISAVLTAPQSGQQTRKNLKEHSLKLIKRLRRQAPTRERAS